MMQKVIRSLLLGVTLTVMAAAVVSAGDEKVPLDKLPKAVVEAVKAKFPKIKMESAVKSTVDGKPGFEVTLRTGKLGIDVVVTAQGKITQIEKELATKDLPKPVAEAFATKYPKANVKRIEELIKDDKTVSFEFLLDTTTKKTLEAYFDPQGKFLQEKDVTPKK
jgi:Putative beta-lactamase-inhibitor-like, PepSY-like